MTAAAFVVLAGAGAVARWVLVRSDAALVGLNVAGAFLLGLLVGTDPGAGVVTALGTGGLGALTTWSTLALRIDERRRTDPRGAGLVLALTVVVGVLAALAGLELAAPGAT